MNSKNQWRLSLDEACVTLRLPTIEFRYTSRRTRIGRDFICINEEIDFGGSLEEDLDWEKVLGTRKTQEEEVEIGIFFDLGSDTGAYWYLL